MRITAPKIELNHISQPTVFKSKWVMVDPDTWLSNGYVSISPQGIIQDCGVVNKQSLQTTDLGEGILMPCLINAHTHLELSALKDRIPMNMGFATWVDQLINERIVLGPKVLISAAHEACQYLWKTGTCAVGEISSLNLTQDLVIQSGLGGVWFLEFLGNNFIDTPPNCRSFSDTLYLSVAGHAPHTTSPKILRALKQKSSGQPFSIHVAESDDEMTFITQSRGEWADFLEDRNVDYSDWGLPAKSPVQHLNNTGILNDKTLVVHLLHANDTDMTILHNLQCSVCICPRSNYNLHNCLPDCERMIQKGLNVCLGTDSLASVNSLSLWDEMTYLWNQCSGLSPKMILSMATTSGAKALGLSHRLGRLSVGFRACLIFVPMNPKTSDEASQQLVAGDFRKDDMIIFTDVTSGIN
jgi:cytosine/adenosine deaminase-related metal-dependent hydrolase